MESKRIRRRLLVVEDDDRLRSLLLKTLRHHGYEAEGVSTASDAFYRIKEDPEQVLLLDEKLPDMTGSQMIQRLKRLNIEVPFVIITGQGDERLAVEMMKQGARDYLVKSVDMLDLIPTVFQRLFREIEGERRLEFAEKALFDSENRFKILFMSTPISIVIFERETGEIIHANSKAYSSYGFTSLDELKEKGFSMESPYSFNDFITWIEKTALEGPQQLEWLSRRKTGELFWEQVHLTSVNIDNVERIMATKVDITEGKEAEKALLKGKERIENLHESTLKLSLAQKEEEVYQIIIEEAEKILEFQLCTVDMVEGEYFVVKATSSQMPEDGSKNMLISNGIAGKSFRTGKTILTDDLWADREAKPILGSYRSLISTPIGDLGLFQAVSTTVSAFDQEDVNLTEILMRHAGEAIKRIRSHEYIKYLGFHDKLTGLFNRSFLEVEMDRLDIERQLPISIIMADLNGLKLVNDTYGHEMGDKMLQSTATILKKSCRKEDIIARWGGDEFVIFLPQTSNHEAQRICQRIGQESQGVMIEAVPISIALGVATKKDKDQSIFDRLSIAEDRMYRNKLAEERSVRSAVLEGLLKTLAEKSFETEDHANRMKRLAIEVGEKVGLPREELDRLTLLVSLHDIGKITISSTILNKPDRLTQKEWEEIRRHTETGYRILCATAEINHVAEDVLCHHERWDGTGYPRGLAGEDIPLLARITSIVDAYDVMTNGRPYKKPMTEEEAILELQNCAGSQFDPRLVHAVVRVLNGR